MAKIIVKKVIAEIKEVYIDPDIWAIAKCPYCKTEYQEEVFNDNYTISTTCRNPKCRKKFKVKIPKYF